MRTYRWDHGTVRFREPLARLYQYVAPLGASVQRSIEWRREGSQFRRLRRARADPIDTITISAEAVLRYAALTFDSRDLTFEEASSLIRLLRRNGMIDRRTKQAFQRALAHSGKAIESDATDGRHNLIAVFERLHNEQSLNWHSTSDIAVTLDTLKTIDALRRGLPRVRLRCLRAAHSRIRFAVSVRMFFADCSACAKSHV